MPEFLEITINKSAIKIATDRLYNEDGVWAKEEVDGIRIGLSDFWRVDLIRRRGLEIMPKGSQVQLGDQVAVIETTKAYISFSAPATGRVLEVNPAISEITKDIYGAGWLAVLEAADWDADRACLLDAHAYSALIKAQAKEKTHKS
jgi:glycine cleavage system H protein